MENQEDIKNKARKIVALLPKKNCGKCGYNNCGEFAVAIAEGKASPYECRKSESSAPLIAEIAGIKLPERAEVHTSDGSHHHHHHLPDGNGHHHIHHHEHHHGGHGKHHHEGDHTHSGHKG